MAKSDLLMYLKVGEEFEDKETREKRTKYYEVGRVWVCEDRNGNPYVQIHLPPGVSISGRAVAFPPKADDEPKQREEPKAPDDPKGSKGTGLPRGRR